MRIALVSPTFPPDACGVGDYSENLASALTSLGAEVRLWTARPGPAVRVGTVAAIRVVPGPWDRRRLVTIREGIRDSRPDAVVLQYTPQLWGPASLGVRPDLPFWVGGLRRELRGAPVAITAHELNYPAGLSPHGLLLGLPQFLQFHALAAAADRVFFTYEAAMSSTARRLPWKVDAFSVLPVGSNIPPPAAGSSEAPGAEALRRDAGIGPDCPILLHFGGLHPTHLLGPMLHALDTIGPSAPSRNSSQSSPWTHSERPEPVLAFAGASRDAVLEKLGELGLMGLAPRIRGLGYLAPADVSRWIGASDLMLAPFMDGVSTRRGSFMAGLAHGRCVVTTRGRSTSGAIPWERICRISPDSSEEGYGAAVARALADPAGTRALGAQGRLYYEESFAWGRIAGALLDSFASSSGSRSRTPAKNQKNAASGL